MPEYHSKLSPSGAKRWMACPGSQKLIEKAIEATPQLANKTNKYAAEGTVAHMIGEKCLGSTAEPSDFLGKTYKQDGYSITVTQEMIDAVDVYVDWVKDYIEGGLQVDIDIELQLEVWGDLTFLEVPGMEGGTSDCILINHDHQYITIADYKHGRGVAVEVDDNPQALAYAVGALNALGVAAEDAKEWRVDLVIVQPRATHPDGPIRVSRTYTGAEIYRWAATKLAPAGLETLKEDAKLVTSDDGCRFCEASGICPALNKKAQELAIADFEKGLLPETDMMTTEQKIAVLDHAEMLRSFIVSVENQVKLEIDNGSEEYKGKYKLVRKTTHRKFTVDAIDPDLGELNDLLTDDELYDTKLKSLTSIEHTLKKRYGAKMGKELMDILTEKPEGALVVAPQSDNRKEAQPSAVNDFEHLDD